MNDNLQWIYGSKLLTLGLCAPFHVKHDIDYYDDLCRKFNLVYECAQESGADSDSLKIIKRYSVRIREAILEYYRGKISTSHMKVKNLIKDVMSNFLAVDMISDSKAFPGTSKEMQFFRARNSEKAMTFSIQDMLHIPFDKRGKTGNYRFSIPGIPSLYLGNTTYACWIELGCPPEHDYYVSPIVVDEKLRILNLAVTTRRLPISDTVDAEFVHTYLKLVMLMIATSYVVEEEDRIFKSEYIISQSIMLACKELGLDGVAYHSKRVADASYANAAINLALFTQYKKGQNYSDICGHIMVGEPYNFALYKQLGLSDRTPTYSDYRMAHTPQETKIGSESRQFEYTETEFSAFDRFLFSTWKMK